MGIFLNEGLLLGIASYTPAQPTLRAIENDGTKTGMRRTRQRRPAPGNHLGDPRTGDPPSEAAHAVHAQLPG